MKQIIININNCEECSHVDHTGGYTRGGAKPCCDHDDITSKTPDCFKRIIPYKRIDSDISNLTICVPKKIPKWCPL